MIWELEFIIQWQLCYATTLTPNEGSGAVKNFRNHNFVLNQDNTIYQMWESPSPLELHSTGSACGFLYHTAASSSGSHRSNNLSGQRGNCGASSFSCGTLWQPMVGWPEKNKMSLSNLPDLKPIHIELSQQKTWYSPLTTSSEEPVYRIPFTCSGPGCHSLDPVHIWALKFHVFVCLPLTFKSSACPLFFSPCLLGWQLLLLEFYGMWQMMTPFSPGTYQAGRGLTSEHPSLISCRSATAGSDLSDDGSARRAGLWLHAYQASRGWYAAVNTFVLR